MTDPSKYHQQQKKHQSPKDLDARILAAANTQAEANAEKNNVSGWNWMPTAATAAVLVIGITFAFNNQIFVSEDFVIKNDSTSLDALESAPNNIANTADRTRESTPAAQPRELEEVIVTARKREESLQDIPVTVSVIGADVIEEAGVNDLYDLFGFAGEVDFDEGELVESQSLDTISIAESEDTFGNDTASKVRFAAVASLAAPTSMNPTLLNTLSVVPDLVLDMRYAKSDNFVGEPIDGYQSSKALLSEPAVQALSAVQNELREQGLGLKVFDAYRPQRAVDHFIRWAQTDDESTKSTYYPNIEKSELFSAGYLTERSSHSRGSTVDLTIAKLNDDGSHEELDMGTIFDFFDARSWPDSIEVSELAQQNRQFLRELMIKHGFEPFETEWWHFTLKDEPYPDQYFDLIVE